MSYGTLLPKAHISLDLANGSFGSGTGQFRVKSVWIGYGFGSGEVQVQIYFGSIIIGSSMDSIRLKSGLGLLRMVLQ